MQIADGHAHNQASNDLTKDKSWSDNSRPTLSLNINKTMWLPIPLRYDYDPG